MLALNRYIVRQVAAPLLFIALGLLGIAWLSQSLRLLERVLMSGFSVGRFFFLTSLLIPNLLTLILPIALFLATLFTLNRLSRESELVVMTGAGLSPLGVTRAVMGLAALVMVVLYACLLFLAPLGVRTLSEQQREIGGNLAQILLQEGVFNTPADGLTLFIRERRSDSELHGILVHDSRDPNAPVTMMAEVGRLVNVDGSLRIFLQNGNRQSFERDRARPSLLYFESYVLNLDEFQKKLDERWREPSERYLHELFWPDESSINDRAYRNNLIMEGHRRLSLPLYVPALTLVALAFLLRGGFERRGQTKRLIAAGATGLLVQILAVGVGTVAARSLWFAPLLYALPLAISAAAYAALARNPLSPIIRWRGI